MTALWSSEASVGLAQCLLADSPILFGDAFHAPSIFDNRAAPPHRRGDLAENIIENHVRTSLSHSNETRVDTRTPPTTALDESEDALLFSAQFSLPPAPRLGFTDADEQALLTHLTHLLLVDTKTLDAAAIEIFPASPASSFAISQAILLSQTLQDLRNMADQCRTASSASGLSLSRYLHETLIDAELRLVNPCTLSSRSSASCDRWNIDNELQQETPPATTSTSLLKASLHRMSDMHSSLADLVSLVAPFVERQQQQQPTSLTMSSNALLSALYKHSLCHPSPSAFARVASPFFLALRCWLAHGIVRTTDFPIQPLPPLVASASSNSLDTADVPALRRLLRLCGFQQTCDFPLFVQSASSAILLCGVLRRICSDFERAFAVSLALPIPSIQLRHFQAPLGHQEGEREGSPSSDQWQAPGLHLINDWVARQPPRPGDLLASIETEILAPISADASLMDAEVMRSLVSVIDIRALFSSLFQYATALDAAQQTTSTEPLFLPHASTPYSQVLSHLVALQSGILNRSCRPFVYLLSQDLVRSVDVFRRIFAEINKALARLRDAWTNPDRLWVRRQKSPSASKFLVALHRAVLFLQQLQQQLEQALKDVWKEHIEEGLRSCSFIHFLGAQADAHTGLNLNLAFVQTARCVHLFTVYVPELLDSVHQESVPSQEVNHLALDGQGSMAFFNGWFGRRSATLDGQ